MMVEPYRPLGFACYYQQTEEDSEELKRIQELKIDARKAAGDWPEPPGGDPKAPANLLAMKRFGRAHRQVAEFVEATFYLPQRNWLRTSGFELHTVLSDDHGYLVTFDFMTAEGRDAFLVAFPKWTTERPKQWWDLAPDVPTAEAIYDMPDDDDC